MKLNRFSSVRIRVLQDPGKSHPPGKPASFIKYHLEGGKPSSARWCKGLLINIDGEFKGVMSPSRGTWFGFTSDNCKPVEPTVKYFHPTFPQCLHMQKVPVCRRPAYYKKHGRLFITPLMVSGKRFKVSFTLQGCLLEEGSNRRRGVSERSRMWFSSTKSFLYARGQVT